MNSRWARRARASPGWQSYRQHRFAYLVLVLLFFIRTSTPQYIKEAASSVEQEVAELPTVAPRYTIGAPIAEIATGSSDTTGPVALIDWHDGTKSFVQCRSKAIVGLGMTLEPADVILPNVGFWWIQAFSSGSCPATLAGSLRQALYPVDT